MKHIKFFCVAAVLILQYFQFTSWQYGWLGWVLFALYILSVGAIWQEIFSRTFGLAASSWLNRIFSWLTVFLLLSFTGSIVVISYLLSPISYFYICLTVALLSWLLTTLWSRKKTRIAPGEGNEEQRELILFRLNWLWICLYLLLWALGFYLLVSQTSGEILFSPWQSISKYTEQIDILIVVLIVIAVVYYFYMHIKRAH